MKTLLYTLFLALVAMSTVSHGQTQTPPPPADPQWFAAIGVNLSQYTDPKVGVAGTVGYLVGAGTYATGTLTESVRKTQTGVDPKTGKPVFAYSPVSIVQAGGRKIILRTGPLTVAGSGTLGLQAGDSSVLGAYGAGGTIAYDVKRLSVGGLTGFIYGDLGILKVASAVPGADPAAVKTAYSFGIGWHN